MSGDMTGEMKTLTIGRLARQAGVNLETIRYYQRVGIITDRCRDIDNTRPTPSTGSVLSSAPSN